MEPLKQYRVPGNIADLSRQKKLSRKEMAQTKFG